MSRILMLSYEYPPLGGGTGIACQQVLNHLGEDPSLRIDLVTSGAGDSAETLRESPRIEIDKLPVGKRDPHFWRAPELARWTTRALRLSGVLARERTYDLCHCWGGWPSGFVGYRLRKSLPYIIGLRGSDVPGYSRRLRVLDRLVFRHLSRRIWHQAGGVVAVSDNLKELARQTVRQLPIEVIRNGVDIEKFSPGKATEPLKILYVGRLIERKGVEHLVTAFADLTARQPELALWLVGEGPEQERLEQLCRAREIADKVRFHGVVGRAEMPELYRQASIFVMPSLEEAMPNAILEAMASGLPVVSTPTGASELIQGNGLIVERSDARALLEALTIYVDSRDLRRFHGRRSRALAETMSWANVARFYREIYDRLIDSGGRDAR